VLRHLYSLSLRGSSTLPRPAILVQLKAADIVASGPALARPRPDWPLSISHHRDARGAQERRER
jgi:hypothetical protein